MERAISRCMEIRGGYYLRVIGINANGSHTAYISKLLDIGDISRFGGGKVDSQARKYRGKILLLSPSCQSLIRCVSSASVEASGPGP